MLRPGVAGKRRNCYKEQPIAPAGPAQEAWINS